VSVVWSCGGGVQSAAIAALIVSGDLPKPDVAVMSDTGREKSATWRYVYMTLTPRLAVAGVELIVLDHAKWSTVDLFGGADKKTVLMPMFTNRDGTVGQTHKYCSNEWKSRPVDRYIRSLGLERGERWIGYSLDEYHRCRAPDEAAAWNQAYPLIDRRMTRTDCQILVARMGWPPAPRSACWMCPYQSDAEWRDTKETDRGDFIMARGVERMVQDIDPHLYLHRSCKPIDTVNLNEAQGDFLRDQCAESECFT